MTNSMGDFPSTLDEYHFQNVARILDKREPMSNDDKAEVFKTIFENDLKVDHISGPRTMAFVSAIVAYSNPTLGGFMGLVSVGLYFRGSRDIARTIADLEHFETEYLKLHPEADKLAAFKYAREKLDELNEVSDSSAFFDKRWLFA